MTRLLSGADTCCDPEGDVGRDAERLVGGGFFAGGFLVDDDAPLLFRVDDGAEIEGMKVEALGRGRAPEVAAAGVSGCCSLGWSPD